MKVAVIGAGAVGSACVMALIMRGCAREIVVLDKDEKRAKAVATDMQYGAVVAKAARVYAGDYSALKDAAVVLITAGVNEKTGGATDRNDPAGRLKLLSTNISIYKDIVPQIVAVTPALILVVTDPPDPLADLTRKLAGHDRVLSTGTYLDSLRFRFHLAQHFHCNPADVDALVLGEHGTSQVFVWSRASIGDQLLNCDKGFQDEIEGEVKFANITIIEGNNASQYGIGMVSARITEMILRDEHAVIPIGSYNQKFGVTLSLPSIVGRKGALKIFEPEMSAQEKKALEASAEILKKSLGEGVTT